MSFIPRYPLRHIAFEDQYKDLTEKETQECMKAMNDDYLTQGYYIKQKAKITLKKELGEDKIDYEPKDGTGPLGRKTTHLNPERLWF